MACGDAAHGQAQSYKSGYNPVLLSNGNIKVGNIEKSRQEGKAAKLLNTCLSYLAASILPYLNQESENDE